MKPQYFPLVLVAFFLSWGLQTKANPELKHAVDTVIDQAIQNKKLVGTVILVARDGNIIYERAAGFKDREAKTVLQTNSIFRYASMTKSIVSMAALHLVDRGIITLDDPVSKWIPDFKPVLLDRSEPTITIRQLLTHTSGLTYSFFEPPNGPYHQLGVSDGLDNKGITLTENIRRLGQAPLVSAPGTKWNYSLSIDVLGEVLAQAAKKPLPDIVKETVTEPLKMTDANFLVTDPSRLTVPYAAKSPEPERMTDPYRVYIGANYIEFSPGRALDPTAFPSGGAGMMGTSHDYFKFLEAIRTGSTGLKPETALLMTTNQIGDLPIDAEGYGFTFGFSYLKNPEQARSPAKVGTLDWGGAYGHNFWLDPQAKLVVVILTNTASLDLATFTSDVKAAIYSSIPGVK
ncbi:serine hydrolase domain-containing protein [Bdellovibrio sp. HCB2-146]|uniref:serine hydrolase domain-containing protein n=1 Tax=Bdellovibrio sp. HCB2-146 TaxID=3394362 RepID=UPI0039BD4D83